VHATKILIVVLHLFLFFLSNSLFNVPSREDSKKMRKLYLHSQSISGFVIIRNLMVWSIRSKISLVDLD
jgi:hypothetical protein